MSWIKTITFENASGHLKALYERVTGPGTNVDNVMMVHSLRPHSMEGHMALYKNVLHHRDNTLPKWLLETIGVWVSQINTCDYCVNHHYAGLQRLLNDDARAAAIKAAFVKGHPDDAPLNDAQKAALHYAELLTRYPHRVAESDLEILRHHGFDDGEILEINQVTAYFCYANRTVLGLGVSTEGDVLGLSPNSDDNPDDWSHA